MLSHLPAIYNPANVPIAPQAPSRSLGPDKHLLDWCATYMPWLEVEYDNLTIEYLPPSQGAETASVTVASTSTFLHEICHMLESTPAQLSIADYNLDSEAMRKPFSKDLDRTLWDVGNWKEVIARELKANYLEFTIVRNALWDQDNIFKLYYEGDLHFTPEYWALQLWKDTLYNAAPAWMTAPKRRVYAKYGDAIRDLEKALRTSRLELR